MNERSKSSAKIEDQHGKKEKYQEVDKGNLDICELKMWKSLWIVMRIAHFSVTATSLVMCVAVTPSIITHCSNRLHSLFGKQIDCTRCHWLH